MRQVAEAILQIPLVYRNMEDVQLMSVAQFYSITLYLASTFPT